MKVRAMAALGFGLIFVAMLGLLSLLTPRITHYTCDGVQSQSYSLLGMSNIGSDGCDDGITSKSTGWPFASKVNTTNLTSTGLVRPNASNGYEYQIGGIIGNLILYWMLGFFFFMIFSPITRNRRYHPNPSEPKIFG